MRSAQWECNVRYAQGLMRALLGAMIFALPLTMTMEMWQLGVTMDYHRLALLLAVTLPMLVALSFYAGFEPTFSLLDNVLDAFAAMAVSAAACLGVLVMFGQIAAGTPLTEVVGKLVVLSFGASIGALLADKQFNDQQSDEDAEAPQRTFGSRLFVMAVGAIFLALNVAPTDEVEIIASSIRSAQAILLCVVSFLALYLIVTVADPGVARAPWPIQLRRSFAGYGICLAMAAATLWVFGRLDGVAIDEAVEFIIVLAFPASLGAGAARLILGSGNRRHKT
jgi:putative integral membrane protein (TIGR02587 family)